MRKLLVFQHVPFEPLGLLDPMFRQAGFRVRYVNFHRSGDTHVPVERYSGLVVLGGPMAADETDRYPHLAVEQAAIRLAIDLEMPVLGICLGAQLIASSCGARPLRGAAPEFGWSAVTPTAEGRGDALFRHFDGAQPIFQWHADTFTPPAGAVHLATSPACDYQAFRIGEHAYGFQFHLEADEALIRRWVASRQNVGVIASGAVAVDADTLHVATEHNIARSKRLAEAVFGEFIARFFGFRRRRAQPSR